MKNFTKLTTIAAVYFLAACKGPSTGNTSKVDSTTPTIKTVTVPANPNTAATNAATASYSNFTVKVPQGWLSQQKSMNGRTLLFLIGPKEMNYQTNMNILKDPMKGETLEDYIKVSLAKMQSMPVTMGASGDFTANGVTGKYLKYVYTAKERIIVVKSYIFAKDNTAYVVTATTIPQNGKKYEPVFDDVVSSLKID